MDVGGVRYFDVRETNKIYFPVRFNNRNIYYRFQLYQK